MRTLPADAAASPERGPDEPASGGPPHRALVIGAFVAVVAGVALRLWTTSDLWLDEALSVNIARLPLGDIPDALRHDGHPPFYYFLLHGWMELFGSGDTAVRVLSAVFAVATLPLAWIAGRRYAGPTGATATFLLLVSSPFAIRYATEARMYSLVTLLVFAGWLMVIRALERARLGLLTGIAVLSGLLMLTHYWAFYLIAATVVVLAWRAWHAEKARRRAGPEQRSDPAPYRRVAVAVLAGGVLFLPWLGGFLDQARNTGTPWTEPERPANIVMLTLQDLGGGYFGEAQMLGWGIGMLALLALLARPLDRWRIELDFRTHPKARPEAAVIAVTLGLAAIAGYATGSGFATRYASVILPLLLLLAGLGVLRLPRGWVRSSVVSALVIIGLVFGVDNALTQRTQGGDIGRMIASQAAPSDVVVFCPDQLGPAVERQLPQRLVALTFPEFGGPERVDWVDYEERNAAADVNAFTAELLDRAGSGDVWLVWSAGYRTLEDKCGDLAAALTTARPAQRVVGPEDTFESAELTRYPAGP